MEQADNDDALIVPAFTQMGVVFGGCTPNDLVHLKQETDTILSYTGLARRAEFMGFADKGSLTGRRIRWKKLVEQIDDPSQDNQMLIRDHDLPSPT